MDNKPISIGIVSTKSNSDKVCDYIDSLYKYYPEHDVPKQYQSMLGHYKDTANHVDLAYFYFKDYPEEIHEVQFSGMIYHKAIFKITDSGLKKIHGEGVGNLGETDRVLMRIEEIIFPKIELLIEKDE